MADTEYLTTRQAAHRLGVSLGTVQQMVETGALEAWKTVGGHRRILASSLDHYLAGRHPNSPSGGEGIDVLVAEDDAAMQLIYRKSFEKWVVPVLLRVVDNGFDALLQIGQQPPDVLITDLMMPDMDGFELIRRLRAHSDYSGMDLIVVSALTPEDIAANGGLPADITVYSKPIPIHEIKGFIQARWIARQRTRAGKARVEAVGR